MNFTLKSVQNGCRLGSLASQTQGIVVETPTCMLYTKMGSVPYLGCDVLSRMKNLPGILHVPAAHYVELCGILEDFGQGLKKFTANQGFMLYTSVHDPAVEVASGYNDKNSVAVWGRSGKSKVDTDKFIRLQECIQPEMYEVISDCDTNKESTSKRLRKSYDNSLRFMDSCIEKHQESKVLNKKWLFGAAGGGYNEVERTRWAKELAQRPVNGYVIEGFHNGGQITEEFILCDVVPLIQASLRELPEEKPRVMHLVWTPDNIIRGVEAGIDMFDSTFPYIVTERGGALNFPYQLHSDQKGEISNHQTYDVASSPDQSNNMQNGPNRPFEINLNDKRYESDQRPLVAGCTCYTCQTHSRSYVTHLLNTSELLAGILLIIHNLHHYLEFFSAIRESLMKGTFEKLKELIIKHKQL